MRPTKKDAAKRDYEDDAQARMVRLMYLLSVAVEQLEHGADTDVIRWTIGEAQAVVRKDIRAQRMSIYQ